MNIRILSNKKVRKVAGVLSFATLALALASCDASRNTKTPTGSLNLKDTYICDISEHMFDSVRNNLKKSMENDIETKKSINSEGSTESNTSIHSLNNNLKDT